MQRNTKDVKCNRWIKNPMHPRAKRTSHKGSMTSAIRGREHAANQRSPNLIPRSADLVPTSFCTCLNHHNRQPTFGANHSRRIKEGGASGGRPTFRVAGRPTLGSANLPPRSADHRPRHNRPCTPTNTPLVHPGYKCPSGGHLQGVVDQDNTSVVV